MNSVEPPSSSSSSTTKQLRLDDSSDDFQSPNLKSSHSKVLKAQKPPPKRAKKKTATNKKTQKLITEAWSTSADIDVDPNDLQMAIALSLSTIEVEQPVLAANSELRMTTLERFGFESNGNKKLLSAQNRAEKYRAVKGRKTSKLKLVPSALFTTSHETRLKQIRANIKLILENNCCKLVDSKNEASSLSQDLRSNRLKGMQCPSNSKAFSVSTLSLEEMQVEDHFYVESLGLSRSTAKMGCLLKDWDAIPGRDRSPGPRTSLSRNLRETSPDLFESEDEDSDGIGEQVTSDSAKYRVNFEDIGSTKDYFQTVRDMFEDNIELGETGGGFMDNSKERHADASVECKQTQEVILKKQQQEQESPSSQFTDFDSCDFLRANNSKERYDNASMECKQTQEIMLKKQQQEQEFPTGQFTDFDSCDISGAHNSKERYANASVECKQTRKIILKKQQQEQESSQSTNFDSCDFSRANTSKENHANVSLECKQTREIILKKQQQEQEFPTSQFTDFDSCGISRANNSKERYANASMECKQTLEITKKKQEQEQESPTSQSTDFDSCDITRANNSKERYANASVECKQTREIMLKKQQQEQESPTTHLAEVYILSSDSEAEEVAIIDLSKSSDEELSGSFHDEELNYSSKLANSLSRDSPPKPSPESALKNSLSPKTPKSGFRVEVDNVTPKPDYQLMTTPQLQSELGKFGLKPLKRARGVQLLNYLYESTHPLIEESESKRPKLQAEEEEEETPIGTRTSPLKRETSSENMSEIFLEKPKSKRVSTCRVPLHVAWRNLLDCNPELTENVLLYEPLQVEVLESMLKEQGFRFDKKDLLNFLDKKCVTIRFAHNRPTQARRKKKTSTHA